MMIHNNLDSLIVRPINEGILSCWGFFLDNALLHLHAFYWRVGIFYSQGDALEEFWLLEGAFVVGRGYLSAVAVGNCFCFHRQNFCLQDGDIDDAGVCDSEGSSIW